MPPVPAIESTAFAARLARGDVSLFAAIPSESTPRDRQSLLAVQRAVRDRWPSYVYLEIGSHLGGSLLPHVLDPGCRLSHSIDPRPTVQPDARGSRFAYPGNSTARMLANLAAAGADPARVRCHEAMAADVSPSALEPRPHLCFIDGEHTADAVLADFAACRRVLEPGGIVLFHDAHIVYDALQLIVDTLDGEGVRYRACHLPDTIVAIELGDGGLLDNEAVAAVRRESHRGYLLSLQSTDHYRRIASTWPVRVFRRLRAVVGVGE